MKKFLPVLVALFVVVSANVCSAYRYDNDPNYVHVINGGQGSIYLNVKSIDVQEYNPPHYQIAGTFIHVSGMPANLGKTRTFYIVKRFNWYAKETYSRNKYGNWVVDDVTGDGNGSSPKIAMDNRAYADALFRAAYGIDFYGY